MPSISKVNTRPGRIGLEHSWLRGDRPRFIYIYLSILLIGSYYTLATSVTSSHRQTTQTNNGSVVLRPRPTALPSLHGAPYTHTYHIPKKMEALRASLKTEHQNFKVVGRNGKGLKWRGEIGLDDSVELTQQIRNGGRG